MTHPTIFGADTLLGETPANMIAGERDEAQGNGSIPVFSPSTGRVIAEMPNASDDAVDRAVSAAVAAQRAWAKKSHGERADVLSRIRDLLAENAHELASIVVHEQGKPLQDAIGEIGGARNFFEFAIAQKFRNVGEVVATEPGERLEVREEAIGVIAAVLPWNFPAAIFARKVAPALMAGNAIVVKPSELTPFSALALAQLCREAGLPDGLLSVVCGPGRETGKALVTHPKIGMVTMTGSTRGGKEIAAQCAPALIPVSLELGGKAPLIIFPDADIDRAIDDAVAARLWNNGQVCTCNEVTYVHSSIYDEVARRIAERFNTLRPSNPFKPGSSIGPLVSDREWSKVAALVETAVEQGATLAVGGGRPEGAEFEEGYFFAPTLLTGVTGDMDIVRQEVFGPVLPLVAFDTYDEVIAAANSTPYGLSAYVYSSDLTTAMRAVDDLEFGEIYVNKAGPERPQGFHTGWKASGLGGDDGAHGYERYLRRKTSYTNYAMGIEN